MEHLHELVLEQQIQAMVKQVVHLVLVVLAVQVE